MNIQIVEEVVRRVLASSPSPSVTSNPPPSVRFIAVSDLSTWEGLDHRPKARLGGVDCGIGDFTEYGIVISIRPRRLICRSPDSSLVVLGASAKPASADATPAASGRLSEAPKAAPSW